MEQTTIRASAAPTSVRSLLAPTQRRWLLVSLGLSALLIANTLYLVAYRLGAISDGGPEEGLSRFYQTMLLGHFGLGSLACLAMLWFAITHLPKVWKRHRKRTVATGLFLVATGLTLAMTGPFIVYASANREHAWVWWTHVVAGMLVIIAYATHRHLSYVRPAPSSPRWFAGVTSALLVLMLLGHVVERHRGAPTSVAKASPRGANDRGFNVPGTTPLEEASGFVPAASVDPRSPFFPSAVTTSSGSYLPSRLITRGNVREPYDLTADLDRQGFVTSETIGADSCARCHQDIVEQWSKSAHRFASFNNPFYEASIEALRKAADQPTKGVMAHVAAHPQWDGEYGKIKSRWCAGCHDPAIMMSGRMVADIDRRSVEAQAGLTCMACHAIDKIHNLTGNGAYNIADEKEDPYLFPEAHTGTAKAFVHDVAIKARPESHKQQMLKPFFRGSEFCSVCHKVSLPEPVNDYRWLRGQNEFDNWHDSGVALNASRTFYLPPTKRVCQDCHMPNEPAVLGDVAAKNGMVRSHRFLAVNTALPHLRSDQETIDRIEAFLRDEKLRIDVFALKREAGSEPLDSEALYPWGQAPTTVARGEMITADVVVRNLGVGHTFPGGTNDSNEAWIEFSVIDEASGEVLYRSGSVGGDGHVDPAAHFFRAVIVDRHGQPIRMRNAQDIYTTVYANVIGPGTAHVVHYSFKVPEDLDSSLVVRARLMWRKFDRSFTEFAYEANPEGFKAFDQCPDLPITEITSSEVRLAVSDDLPSALAKQGPAASGASDPSNWIRFNDYGIGLLLQGDTKGAARAFEQVARMVPERIDGYRNLARVALSNGDLERAREQLLKCETIKPGDPQTAWFWGVLLQEEGSYADAAKAYERVLGSFPEDRATWRNLGRVLFLDGAYDRAVEAFQRVLSIDPEDRVAHYHLMLCHRSLGKIELAAASEAAYEFHKIDESAQQVTQGYRLTNPHDNRESQVIHIHELKPLIASMQAEVSAENMTADVDSRDVER